METYNQIFKEPPLYNAINNACRSTKVNKLSQKELEIFVESIVSYDGMYERFLNSPENVSIDIFSNKISNHIVIPCYIVELRGILRRKIICSNYKIAAFSLETAKQYLYEYGAFLVCDINKITEKCLVSLDGIRIFDNEINIESSLVKVFACDRLDSDNATVVEKIVGSEAPHLQFGVLTDSPGISFKQSQVEPKKNKLDKYVVNIPSLGINKEIIKNINEYSALQECLNRKWKETGNPHKNPEYTAEYWINSPAINGNEALIFDLVHKVAGMTYITKISSVNLKLPISVDSEEQEIFDLLLQINDKYNLGITFRVAGGWVRDRALGIMSKDIDIALDKMTGAQFCKYITKEIGKKPAIIEADEKKSKSLETATINLGSGNIPIDFVNLRKEVYEPGSRVPKMTFGTPQEDAERRDLTLNALFYNINTSQIEDFTGKGLEDLENLTLRTPLNPEQTFADDPLRVFRVLRFYSKFQGSKIADETMNALFDPNVQEALDPKNLIDVEVAVMDKNGNQSIDPETGKPKFTIEQQRKISEERILTEWKKLFRGPQAAKALRVAYESGLWDKVFVAGAKDFDTSKWNPFTMDQNNAHHVDNVFEHTIKVVEEYDKILRADGVGDDERALLLCAAFMHDLGKLDPNIIGTKEVEGIIRNTYHGHEDVSALAAEAILKGIKSSNEDIELIRNVVKNHMIPHQDMSDKQINKMIRNLGKNVVRRIIQHAKADSMSKPGSDVSHYDSLLERTQNALAVEPKQVKPVVQGGAIIKLFPNLDPKSGFIKEIQDRLQDMKDENPLLTEQEGLVAIEQMRQEIESKYLNFVYRKKVDQKQVQQPLPQPPQRQSHVFNLSKIAEGNGTVDFICGNVKIVDGKLSLVSEKGTFNLKGNEELSKLVGERICGKGMVNRKDFTVSEYNVVRIDPNDEVLEMERQSPEESTKFRVGDRVRHRKRGLAFKQIAGEVKKIEHNLMYVKWDGVEELEVFDLRDPVSIFGLLQKI